MFPLALAGEAAKLGRAQPAIEHARTDKGHRARCAKTPPEKAGQNSREINGRSTARGRAANHPVLRHAAKLLAVEVSFKDPR